MPPNTRQSVRLRRVRRPKSQPRKGPRRSKQNLRNPPPKTRKRNRPRKNDLQFQPFQILAERRTQLSILQRNLYRRFQKAQLVSRVVRGSLVDVCPQAALLSQNS